MKILILTHDTDTNSGWGRYASQLINGLKQKGFIITVLTEKFEGDSKTSILGRGSKVFSSAFKVIPYAREADIIHALDVYPYGIIAWIASKIAGRPLLINLLGTYAIAPFYHRKTRWLSKRACLSASCLIAISNYTKSEFNKILPSVEVEVINPGIDYGKQHVDRSESGQPFILSVGALKKRKGYHIAISAFAVARRKFPELKYKIIGSQKDIQYFNGLKELTKKLSLENSIEFESNVSDDNLANKLLESLSKAFDVLPAHLKERLQNELRTLSVKIPLLAQPGGLEPSADVSKQKKKELDIIKEEVKTLAELLKLDEQHVLVVSDANDKLRQRLAFEANLIQIKREIAKIGGISNLTDTQALELGSRLINVEAEKLKLI